MVKGSGEIIRWRSDFEDQAVIEGSDLLVKKIIIWPEWEWTVE